jgi:cytochrome c biogenesis protein CcmG, thiol:disulfide interchange protein DsbE
MALKRNMMMNRQKEGDMKEAEMISEKPVRRTRHRRVLVIIFVSLFNIGLLALLGSQLLTPAQNQNSSDSNSSPLLGHPAPDFTLAALSNSPMPAVHLTNFKGKPIVLNFWASWCDPCKHEAPLLEAIWQRVQSQGVVFLGIDYDDTQGDGLSFLQTYGITYRSAMDTGGAVSINYGVSGVPETFFIDRHGVIVQKVIGELTQQTLQANIQALLR